MRLIEARITNFKSIEDSGTVRFDDVTCLVGKNESGKTAFLQALQKINPVSGVTGDLNILDYPRKGYTKYKLAHDESPATVVTVVFELSDEEAEEIEADYGSGVLKSRIVSASKNYKNQRTWQLEVDESAAVKHFLTEAALPPNIAKEASECKTCQELLSFLELHKAEAEVEPVLDKARSHWNSNLAEKIASEYLDDSMPQFIYFADYSVMPGSVSIQNLKSLRDSNKLSPSYHTLLALLSIVGTKPEDYENQNNYESLKAELEAASIGITDEVFAFWTQNEQLEVEFDIAQANPNDPPELNSGTILHIRIKNNRHKVSVPFDQRSKGFVWFFSFLAYFSQYEENTDLILLLDEPGLSLHAKAQGDFLNFINKRLAPKHQVIYTTHSPFMVDPTRLKQVRTVQDVDEQGTVVSSDVLRNDRDTIFPLQAALGYDLAQTLFVGPDCLLVEGPSDLIYLQILSQVCASQSFDQLDPRWVVVPVGGADKVSTFVSLLGANQLNIAVLMDISSKDMQRIKTLQSNDFLGASSLVNIGSIIGASDADIEDLFDMSFYLKLVNRAYSDQLPAELKVADLKDGNPRIVKRLETHFRDNNIAGGRFSHYLPAVYLLNKQKDLLKSLGSTTVQNAASLFAKVNSLLS